MIQYIYFVKCPGCEDEHFDFFDEAKEFALGCLSQKPIITQTEVCRNDFGECTDHCDLGTVWSWEDMMKETEAEPTKFIFTRDDLKDYAPDCDPEFDSIDNSVDFEVAEPVTSEVSAIDEIPDNFRKPIPEGMTIEELVEEMEENEDEVECTWCEDLFDKSECRYEINLGWLCSRCEAAIKSRGETLTFREGSYWDFLDEDIEKPSDEDLDWHTYKITFSTKANPDKEQTTTFKTWQSDVEYAWRKSNANIPHTTIKSIELIEDNRRDPFDHHDSEYDEDEAVDCLADMIDGAKDDLYDSSLDTLEEAADYRKRLVLCPECGDEHSYDRETSFCLNCGFN